MGVLKDDIAAFGKMRKELEARHRNAWALFHKGRFEGVFPDYEHAAEFALDRFDRGPYLIRQIGAGPIDLGGGMIFQSSHAHGSGRF